MSAGVSVGIGSSESAARMRMSPELKCFSMSARISEFGLIQRPGKDLRAYGAGLCSSIGEVQYALDSDVPVRKPFDPIDALRTPYRIDIYQTIYFVIQNSDELFRLAQMDLLDMIVEARRLGMHPPTFPPKEKAAS